MRALAVGVVIAAVGCAGTAGVTSGGGTTSTSATSTTEVEGQECGTDATGYRLSYDNCVTWTMVGTTAPTTKRTATTDTAIDRFELCKSEPDPLLCLTGTTATTVYRPTIAEIVHICEDEVIESSGEIDLDECVDRYAEVYGYTDPYEDPYEGIAPDPPEYPIDEDIPYPERPEPEYPEPEPDFPDPPSPYG